MSQLTEEISRRRTFAIISHPDAGKTTLTEKFLLYGGAIAQAGVVKGKKNSRAATSDWMEIEKQRGISVTSSVMQFQYDGFCINILDTPGHQDFSEDTYRTLMAGGVQNVDAEAVVLKLHHGGRDGNTALLFDLHPVGGGGAGIFLALDHACLSDGAAVEQEFFGQGGFTGVGVRNDGKGTPPADFFG